MNIECIACSFGWAPRRWLRKLGGVVGIRMQFNFLRISEQAFFWVGFITSNAPMHRFRLWWGSALSSQKFQPKTMLFETNNWNGSQDDFFLRCFKLELPGGQVSCMKDFEVAQETWPLENSPNKYLKKNSSHVDIHVIFSIHAWSSMPEKSWSQCTPWPVQNPFP